eukprot:3715640-Amphidinium_carterae.1
MWNNLLPGKYAALIPSFRNDRRQRDVRVFEQYIPRVIEFLEAWENVPENKQPKWYKAALAGYNIVEHLRWIFEQDKPQDWIQPLPEAGANTVPNYVPSVQSPQTTGNAATEASVPAAWQSYSANSSQPSADTAASSWQKPA